MSDDDRLRWDRRYAERPPVTDDDVGLPALFRPYTDEFPLRGNALDLACGLGAAAVWLALRGLYVHGVDVSPVAIEAARGLARHWQVDRHCRFDVADLDAGLPAEPPADVVICNKFRDPGLDAAIVERLAPGGLLAISVLSEVGAVAAPFRARAGELREAFEESGALTVIACHEGDGQAWLIARR